MRSSCPCFVFAVSVTTGVSPRSGVTTTGQVTRCRPLIGQSDPVPAPDWSLLLRSGPEELLEGAWGVNSLSFRRIVIFLALSVTCCYISSPPQGPHVMTQITAKIPTRRRIVCNQRDQKGKRELNCFPRFPVEFSQGDIYMGFYVCKVRKNIHIKNTFTLDTSIHHPLLLKLWS